MDSLKRKYEKFHFLKLYHIINLKFCLITYIRNNLRMNLTRLCVVSLTDVTDITNLYLARTPQGEQNHIENDWRKVTLLKSTKMYFFTLNQLSYNLVDKTRLPKSVSYLRHKPCIRWERKPPDPFASYQFGYQR